MYCRTKDYRKKHNEKQYEDLLRQHKSTRFQTAGAIKNPFSTKTSSSTQTDNSSLTTDFPPTLIEYEATEK